MHSSTHCRPTNACTHTSTLHTHTGLPLRTPPCPPCPGELLHSINVRSFSDSVAWNPLYPVMAYTEEKEDRERQGEKQGFVCIMAAPK